MSIKTRSFGQWLAVLACCVAFASPTRAQAQPTEPPHFKISASLSWSDTFAGDPLRVRVRLSCPKASRAAALQAQLAEQGQPVGDPVPAPTIATNWHQGVALNLFLVETNQPRQLLLATEQWNPFLRPVLSEVPALEGLLTARSREWLVPATAAALAAGTYVLTVTWNGAGMVQSDLLPPGGLVTGEDVVISVREPEDDNEQATHLGRLAFENYMRGKPDEARKFGQQALQLDGNRMDRERLQTHLLVANAGLQMKDYLGTADTLQEMGKTYGNLPQDEILETAKARLTILAPRLQVAPGATPENFSFQVMSLEGQRYVSYRSMDLSNWTAISTNIGTGTWFDVHDAGTPPAKARFYRTVWTP